jgi:hypothetical protein
LVSFLLSISIHHQSKFSIHTNLYLENNRFCKDDYGAEVPQAVAVAAVVAAAVVAKIMKGDKTLFLLMVGLY